jgi:Flp pilus assembly pilin Flp
MATATEYGLLAAGISVAIIAAVNGFGAGLNSDFRRSAQTTTTRPVERASFEKRCPAYEGLKDNYPDVYAYLQRNNAVLPGCNS